MRTRPASCRNFAAYISHLVQQEFLLQAAIVDRLYANLDWLPGFDLTRVACFACSALSTMIVR